MSARTSYVATAPARRSSPVFSTWATALLLPLGPAAVAVLRLVLPYYTAGSPEETVAEVGRHPGAQSAVLWLGLVAVLTLVPGVIAAAGICRAAAPRLTSWALALAVPGYLALAVMLGADQLLWSAHQAGLSASQSAALFSAAHPTVGIATGIFVVGHVVGTVLLGIALVRSGRVPAWAGWATAVSQPLHFVATVFLGSPQVDFVGWSLTAVGMAMVARELLRSDSSTEPVTPRP
ncbi:DUF4386 family protein [Pedococcus bigeumensis]|uniref:DUF4386 family protein n=1 Tax=Pedococcus bigeumensis TaxID=433644 RepID=A0A502CM86_9MICO|nr:DUF4386 family protein [Pedococcus bigeumensis]TPG12886.1 DUF4386 family protein [Pedococcus bigeumensis]